MYISARVRNSDERANKETDQDLLSNLIEDFTDFLIQDDDAKAAGPQADIKIIQ